jgi:tRNA 2-thiouridine synthesizing protein A
MPTDVPASVTALDCTGLRCPMPIVKLGLAIRPLPAGARVEVRADDAAFEPDLRAWARQTGHAIVEFDAGAVTRALVEKV